LQRQGGKLSRGAKQRRQGPPDRIPIDAALPVDRPDWGRPGARCPEFMKQAVAAEQQEFSIAVTKL
jgi:hypothetical protein